MGIINTATLLVRSAFVAGVVIFSSASSRVQSAPVPPTASAPFRIALLSDTHTTRGVKEDQALYKGRFDAVIQSVNAATVDFAVVAGDLTQGGKDEEFADFRAQVAGLKAPARWVPGNHDVGAKKIDGKPEGVTAARVTFYEARMGASFWVQEFPWGRMVGINASLLGSDLPREREQWEFLEKTLLAPQEAATNATQTPVGTTILVLHYPPFLVSPDEAGGDYWNIEPKPRARLLDLIKRGHVKVVLSGHVHRPIENNVDGVLYLTTPPVSFGLPRGVQAEGWTLVTVSPQGEISSQWHPISDTETPVVAGK